MYEYNFTTKHFFDEYLERVRVYIFVNVVASNTTSQLLLAAASHLEHDTARGATCSINAHHARIVKFFVQKYFRTI